MSKVYSSADQLIGKTPVLELKNVEKKYNLKAKILAKLEFFNVAGSVKDRVAKKMIDDAEKDGRLTHDSVIIEPTSGNTGIGLASVCAARGYKLIIVMPETMSIERRRIISAYGAELVLTDGKKGMSGAIEKAEELVKEIPNAVIAGQFINPSNPQAHYETTGPEIIEDTEGDIDVFVSAVGTGGTISGTGKYLKEKLEDIEIIAVEPENSPILSGGQAGAHKIQGIGAGFVPEVLDTQIYDQVVRVSDEDAYKTGQMIGKTEGILIGISSSAALCAAIKLAKMPEYEGKTILVLLPDTGERYISTPEYFI